jgi:murein DD-endopeptidase MepM/ murein hydrolase activator NlpD
MLTDILKRHQPFQPVVLFDPAADQLYPMDFTAANTALTPEILDDEFLFSDYVTQTLAKYHAAFGIGGYDEHRTIYSRSAHFNTADEPRSLHLAIDIWGPAGTPVYAPLDGQIHSFQFNDDYHDYGATIILRHVLEGVTFHTLYGHLSLADLDGLQAGARVAAGQMIAHMGPLAENGHWPPHLHFQLIIDMEGKAGDYPGVCRYSERDKYLANCPDPNLILMAL